MRGFDTRGLGSLVSQSDEFVATGTPTLSIAMPVYNGGSFLLVAVRSVVNQSFRDWELLVIDDGSTDGATDDLRSISDSRIRILRNSENLGLASRLNEAIDVASGRYFARMDADDICHPDRFRDQIDFMETNPTIDLLGTKCLTIDEEGAIAGVLPHAIKHDALCRYPWRGFYLPHPTWLGRVNWFRSHRYASPAPYCCEDQELLLRTYSISKFHVLPTILLAYRIRTKLSWKKSWRTRVALFRVQSQFFLANGKYFYACLAGLATLYRLLSDCLWSISSVFSKPTDITRNVLLPAAELAVWQNVISSSSDNLAKPPNGEP